MLLHGDSLQCQIVTRGQAYLKYWNLQSVFENSLKLAVSE